MIKSCFLIFTLFLVSCTKQPLSVITLQKECPPATYPIVPTFEEEMIRNMDIHTRQKILDIITPLYLDKQLQNKWAEENK